MLQVNRISKSYGATPILQNVNFSIQPSDRAGLIGANGCGKSTLLEIITGNLQPDSGTITTAEGVHLGYLPQNMYLHLNQTIRQCLEGQIPGLRQAREHLEAYTATFPSTDPAHLQAYGDALTHYEALGGYTWEYHALELLAGLGLAYLLLDTSLDQLSGGELTRVHLAGLLLAQPDILFLDEPTNHLDIESLEWLENFLASCDSAVLIVSHDRVFLDHTVRRILELDESSHTLREYSGNYSAYVTQKENELQKQLASWQDQQHEIQRLKADVHRTAEQARQTERATNDSAMRRYAKKVAKKAKAEEKRLERYLESEERVEKPDQSWRLRVNFGESPHQGQIVFQTNTLGHTYGDGWLFKNLDLTVKQGDRIALVGPNGAGKSTLLKTLLGELQPAAGTVRIGPSVRPGYMPQAQETLDPGQSPLQLIQAINPMSQSEAHHFLHYFLFEEEQVILPSRNLSFGQRSRLLLAELVASGANCLILDEPVNHLDIPSREQFELALAAFHGSVIIVAHDRAFIQRTSNILWTLKDGDLSVKYLKNIIA
jgi:ATP-binding cassette subfamily F protein 3